MISLAFLASFSSWFSNLTSVLLWLTILYPLFFSTNFLNLTIWLHYLLSYALTYNTYVILVYMSVIHFLAFFFYPFCLLSENEREPLKKFFLSLSNGMRLSFVSRSYWRDISGGESFPSWLQCSPGRLL